MILVAFSCGMTMVLTDSNSSVPLKSNSAHQMFPSHLQNHGGTLEDSLLERELEAEICQRFVRLSCEKMLASRNSRGGARLHRNLLILHLLRKARYNTKMLVFTLFARFTVL
jgi:hypothetical protein